MRTPRFIALAAAALASSCSSSSGGGDPGATPGTFVAFASDFQGYHSWQSFHDMDDDAIDGVHPAGGRTEYINHTPPHGSTSYPVGTIIVKEPDDDPSDTQIFAMVKRGGDYDSAGAVDWEWFEILPGPSDSVSIVWRGFGPSTGTVDSYGGNPAVCNDCHLTGRADDFVLSSAFSLSTF